MHIRPRHQLYSLQCCSFYACVWVKEDLDPGASLLEYKHTLASFETLKEPNAAYLALTRETTLRVSMELGQHRPLAKGFSRLFDALMVGFAPLTEVRAAAARSSMTPTLLVSVVSLS